MYQVVIVDDEWWALQGVEETFPWAESNFEVIKTSTDSEEALHSILELKPDVVFTDVRMPVFSGIDLIKKIRKKSLDIEFIIISGFAEFSYAQAAIRQGAFDYCLKPIEEYKAKELLNSLKYHLDQKSQISNSKSSFNFKNIDNDNFREMVEYINGNYDQNLKLFMLANKFAFNENYSCQLFKKYLDCTFSEYLKRIRMEKAKQLLIEDNSKTINNISLEVGYNNSNYFSKVFKKYFGESPGKFRNRH